MSPATGDLRNRVALVTGGGTGLGRACALRLAAEGTAVAANYSRSEGEAESTASEIRAGGGQALAIRADIADEDAVQRMVDTIQEALGCVDVLVASAGITEFVPFDELDRLTADIWERILRVNVVGTFFSIKAVARGMAQRGFGRVVVVSSNSAFGGGGSSIPYVVSKGALVTLVRCLARTLAPDVQVNAVAPGWMLTPWLDRHFPPQLADELRADGATAVDVDDVASLIVAVASNGSLTGQAIVADRGEAGF